MALENPINAYLQVALAKNQNRQQAQQDAMGIGQNLSSGMDAITQAIQAQKKKQILDQIVMAMKNQGQPQQGPQMPVPFGPAIQGPEGYSPPNQMPGLSAVSAGQIPMKMPDNPTSGIGVPAPDQSKLIDSLMMQYDPNTSIKAMYERQDPLRQSEIQKNLASAKHLNSIGLLPGSSSSVWRNSATGETTDQPPTDPAGWVEYKVKPGQALQTLTNKGFRDNIAGLTWDKFTPGEQSFAKNIYNGDIDPSSLGPREKTRYAYAANLYADQNGLPPFQSFGAKTKGATAKAFTSGKPSQNILSLNTAIGHAGTAMEAYDGVKNTDKRWLNKGLNELRNQTNDPNIIKLGISLNALQGELATVFKGTAGTDQEIGYWVKYLSQDLTPTQASSAIPQIVELLKSRQGGLEYNRKVGMSNRPGDMPIMSPHAQDIVNNLARKNNNSGGGLTPQEQAEFQALHAKYGGK